MRAFVVLFKDDGGEFDLAPSTGLAFNEDVVGIEERINALIHLATGEGQEVGVVEVQPIIAGDTIVVQAHIRGEFDGL